MNAKIITQIMVVVAILWLVVMSSGCMEERETSGKSSKTISEADYKAACKQVPVSDLTKNADQFKGQKVKYTGQILVMDFTQETDSGEKIPYGIILAVKDDTYVLPSGLLPVYVTYHGTTDSFIYDNVTVYGEVYGMYKFKSITIEKTLPRIDVKYLVMEQ